MKPEDIAKAAHHAKEIKDMQDDLRDIATIFANANAGFGFDRNKAEEIIRKNNVSDPYVMARNNNPATTIPLSQASIQTLAENLSFLQSYLNGKLLAKLERADQEENHNNQRK